MTQSHNPPSECPRLGGAGPTRKALRTVHRTAVSGMWVNGTDPVTLHSQRQSLCAGRMWLIIKGDLR